MTKAPPHVGSFMHLRAGEVGSGHACPWAMMTLLVLMTMSPCVQNTSGHKLPCSLAFLFLAKTASVSLWKSEPCALCNAALCHRASSARYSPRFESAENVEAT